MQNIATFLYPQCKVKHCKCQGNVKGMSRECPAAGSGAFPDFTVYISPFLKLYWFRVLSFCTPFFECFLSMISSFRMFSSFTLLFLLRHSFL